MSTDLVLTFDQLLKIASLGRQKSRLVQMLDALVRDGDPDLFIEAPTTFDGLPLSLDIDWDLLSQEAAESLKSVLYGHALDQLAALEKQVLNEFGVRLFASDEERTEHLMLDADEPAGKSDPSPALMS